MEEQVEESKEPEKPESKAPEEEEPARIEEDREVHRILLNHQADKISLFQRI